MAEPEDVILEGAHVATSWVARLWQRRAAGAARVISLGEVRPRLELLVGALFRDAPPIVVAEPAPRPSFVGRLARRIPRHLLDDRAWASTDGTRIRLPPALDAADGREAATARYRLLAVEQAARAARGSPRALAEPLPSEVRDLYLLSEAAAVDYRLATELPGLAAALRAARRDALAGRPGDAVLTAREREIEHLLRAVLGADPEILPEGLPLAASPAASLAWARARAARCASLGGRYRGLPPAGLWGRTEPPPSPGGPPPRRRAEERAALEPRVAPARVHMLRRRPRVREAQEGEDDAAMGMWMIQLDDPQEHVEDPMGLARPADRDTEADADALADSLAELPEARLVNTPGAPAEVLASEDPPPRRAVAHPETTVRRGGVAYPEWDHRLGAYHPARAVVREMSVGEGDARWVEDVLRRHARELAEVRRRFERLRPQRVRLGRQLDGDDVDIAAYALAHADARAGLALDDRLYEAVRPARRDLAISLLVDISGSTDGWLARHQRIIDVEKEALLLVCEALDALGDRYSVAAFSGEGPAGVAVYPIKRFSERYAAGVRRRIAGLDHDRYTRMGAALRHATALLCRERTRHRLLLLLTDGKPNDVDVYEGRYGIEDTRQAVVEARLQGVHPFCLTVDREAPAYLPRLFGAGSYAVLQRAQTLPQALLEVVRRLLQG